MGRSASCRPGWQRRQWRRSVLRWAGCEAPRCSQVDRLVNLEEVSPLCDYPVPRFSMALGPRRARCSPTRTILPTRLPNWWRLLGAMICAATEASGSDPRWAEHRNNAAPPAHLNIYPEHTRGISPGRQRRRACRGSPRCFCCATCPCRSRGFCQPDAAEHRVQQPVAGSVGSSICKARRPGAPCAQSSVSTGLTRDRPYCMRSLSIVFLECCQPLTFS